MADLFNVVFAGEIARGSDPVAVKANIARLFKANDAMIEKLFSGQRIAVKKAVDQATAMKYRAVMKQAGAIASIEEANEQGRPQAVPPAAPTAPPAVVTASAAVTAPPPASAAPAAAKPPTMADRLAALAAEHAQSNALKPRADAPPPPADVAQAGSWRLFPAGSLLVEIKSMPAPMLPNISGITLANPGAELLKDEERRQLAPAPVAVPDISAINLAPVGGDLLKTEEKLSVTPVQVDVSALSMAPPDTELLKENEKRVVVPVVVDVSAITVAPPGADLEQIKDDKKPVNPDISKLKLA